MFVRSMSTSRTRLCLEVLENRLTPAPMTFVEDFSSDTQAGQPGFDQYDNDVTTPSPDSFLVWSELTGGNETPTNGPYSDRGYFAIEPDAAAPSQPHALRFYHLNTSFAPANFSFVFDNPELPGIGPGEQCVGVSFAVSGTGSFYVSGRNGLVGMEFDLGDSFEMFSFSSRTLNSTGIAIGGIVAVSFGTYDEIAIDDVTVTIDEIVTAVGEGNVQVRTLGPDLGIIGDAKSNAIEVTLLNAETGEVRVAGLGNTTVNGVAEVVVSGVFRDTYITLDKGDDYVSVSGLDYQTPFALDDDLLIDAGGGNNTIVLNLVDVGDLLAMHSRAGADVFQMVYTEIERFDVRTGAGDDDIDIANSCQLWGTTLGGNESHGVRTGMGNDSVTLRFGNVHGPLAIDLSEGNDWLSFGAYCPDSVFIDMGPNRDELHLTNPSLQGGFEVQFGGGLDELFISDGHFSQARFRPGDGGAILHVPAKFSCSDRNGNQSFITINDRDDLNELTEVGARVEIDRLQLQV